MVASAPYPPGWYRPRSSTCLVWALVQKRRFGGRIAIIQNRHYPWLYRAIWSPDGLEWYSYTPLRPANNAPIRATLHAVWFRGAPRPVRAPDDGYWLKF